MKILPTHCFEVSDEGDDRLTDQLMEHCKIETSSSSSSGLRAISLFDARAAITALTFVQKAKDY
jgi:hypothetical protein